MSRYKLIIENEDERQLLESALCEEIERMYEDEENVPLAEELETIWSRLKRI